MYNAITSVVACLPGSNTEIRKSRTGGATRPTFLSSVPFDVLPTISRMSVIDNSCTSIAPSSLLYDGDTFSQAPTAFIDLGEASTYGQPIASGGLHNYTSDVESYNTPSPACSFDFDPVSSSNSARSLSPPFELASSFQQPIQHTHYTTSSTHTKGALASLPYFHQQAQAASTAYSSAADLVRYSSEDFVLSS